MLLKLLADPSAYLGGRHCAGHTSYLCSTPEQQHRRDTADAKPPGNCLLDVGVEFDKTGARLDRRRGLLELGRHRSARSTPWRPDVDNYRNGALGHLSFEDIADHVGRLS
jgi:hypothetical protein